MVPKIQLISYAIGAWAFGVLALLVLSSSLSYELFFGLSLLGLLIVVELAGPYRLRPAWRANLDILIGAGLVVFSAIILLSVLNATGMRW